MPVDVAMRLCLAHSPPLKSFLGPYSDFQRRNFVNKLKPLKPCLNLKQEAKSQNEWKRSHDQAKKRVVFADSKGLSLTAIHFFSELPEEPAWDLQFDLLDLNDISSGLKLHEEKNLVLDFPQAGLISSYVAKDDLNFWPSYLYLPSTGITGMCYYAQLDTEPSFKSARQAHPSDQASPRDLDSSVL